MNVYQVEIERIDYSESGAGPTLEHATFQTKLFFQYQDAVQFMKQAFLDVFQKIKLDDESHAHYFPAIYTEHRNWNNSPLLLHWSIKEAELSYDQMPVSFDFKLRSVRIEGESKTIETESNTIEELQFPF